MNDKWVKHRLAELGLSCRQGAGPTRGCVSLGHPSGPVRLILLQVLMLRRRRVETCGQGEAVGLYRVRQEAGQGPATWRWGGAREQGRPGLVAWDWDWDRSVAGAPWAKAGGASGKGGVARESEGTGEGTAGNGLRAL